MKLAELFLTDEDKVKKALSKLKSFQQQVEDGDSPEVRNAGGYMGGVAWGDLEQLGWARKESEPAGGNYMRDRWVYLKDAPGPITLIKNGGKDKVVMQPGDSTEWVEWDPT